MKILKRGAVVILALLLSSCSSYQFAHLIGGYGGDLSKPQDAHVDLSNTTLDKFDSSSRATILRYLAGNGRWEVREERGIQYAIRLEKVDGQYRTELNGYYSSMSGSDWTQTRVLISFGAPYSAYTDRGNITTVHVGDRDASVVSVQEGTFRIMLRRVTRDA